LATLQGKNMSFNKEENEFRVNRQIRVPQVRVVLGDKQLGVMSTDRAKKIAEEHGLDLVEVAPDARPPVCKIVDFGRFRYDLQIKKKEQTKKQRDSQIILKELRFRPTIGDHDIEVKISQAKKFLEDGMKVQLNLMFRGARELSHKEQGFNVIKKVIETLSSLSSVDKPPKMDGNKIICCLTPKA